MNRYTRELGIKEGNAIETIIAFDMRTKKGIATEADRLARDAAYLELGNNAPSALYGWHAVKHITAILLLCALGSLMLIAVSYALNSFMLAVAHP